MEPRESSRKRLSISSRVKYNAPFDYTVYDKSDCYNFLIGGINILKLVKRGRPHTRRFFIYENNKHILY